MLVVVVVVVFMVVVVLVIAARRYAQVWILSTVDSFWRRVWRGVVCGRGSGQWQSNGFSKILYELPPQLDGDLASNHKLVVEGSEASVDGQERDQRVVRMDRKRKRERWHNGRERCGWRRRICSDE
jgi:hypothetical protein